MRFSDFVLIGGGVIGLSVAFALAAEGVSVSLLDAAAPGQASAAAAGMLAPLAEAGRRGAFASLAAESLSLWPSFADHLREETGTPLSLAGPGMLRVARTEAEDAALCAALDWQQGLGLPLHRLSAADVHLLEPALRPSGFGAILSPSERHVEPRVLLQALRDACQRRGVVIHSSTRVTGFAADGGRIGALRTTEGLISGGEYVLTAGAWSAAVGAGLGADFPVQPLRGQILAFGPLPALFRHTIYTHSGYLVPRGDGRVIAGATEEQAGFDPRTTEEGLASLAAMAASLIPGLADARRHSAWAGLRPVSPDGLPLLGRVPGWDNAHVATGHGRNGILLTPLTGKLMAAYLLHAAALPAALDPARFGSTGIGGSE